MHHTPHRQPLIKRNRTMAIVASYDWESDSFTHHGDVRQAWREAVAEIAEKAKAPLPECNGRVDSAVKIVLAGDVELLEAARPRWPARAMAAQRTLWSMGNVSVKTSPRLLASGASIG